jgi:hypothetical protein
MCTMLTSVRLKLDASAETAIRSCFMAPAFARACHDHMIVYTQLLCCVKLTGEPARHMGEHHGTTASTVVQAAVRDCTNGLPARWRYCRNERKQLQNKQVLCVLGLQPSVPEDHPNTTMAASLVLQPPTRSS